MVRVETGTCWRSPQKSGVGVGGCEVSGFPGRRHGNGSPRMKELESACGMKTLQVLCKMYLMVAHAKEGWRGFGWGH